MADPVLLACSGQIIEYNEYTVVLVVSPPDTAPAQHHQRGVPHTVFLGKNQNSKFKVQFPQSRYWFHIVVSQGLSACIYPPIMLYI